MEIGTTETQRAVSYYEIPSRAEDPGYLDKMGDVIPAGRFNHAYHRSSFQLTEYFNIRARYERRTIIGCGPHIFRKRKASIMQRWGVRGDLRSSRRAWY